MEGWATVVRASHASGTGFKTCISLSCQMFLNKDYIRERTVQLYCAERLCSALSPEHPCPGYFNTADAPTGAFAFRVFCVGKSHIGVAR